MAKIEGEVLVTDFASMRPGVHKLAGHAESRSTTYVAYIVGIYLIKIYLFCMSLGAEYVIAGDMELMVKASHLLILLIYSSWVLTSRILSNDSLKSTSELLRNGIFQYQAEERDEEVVRILRTGLVSVKNRSNALAAMFCTSGVSYVIIMPLSQIFFVAEDDDSPLNPYLPYPLYMPFDTYNLFGYTAAFVLNILFSVCTFGVVISMNDTFISCTVQLKSQLQILNHSLRNIHRRAYAMYCKMYGPEGVELEQLYFESNFQYCMYRCLRENIRHHQALLRFKKEFDGYIGASLFIVTGVASFVYATHLYLVIENPPLNMLINYLVALFAEIAYPLYLCYCGEEIIQESSKVFQSLYHTPWMYCDKRFVQLLRIMMSYTIQPMKVQAIIFKIAASLETFADSVSGMYKVVNLIRHWNKL